MSNLLEISILLVSTIFDHVNLFLTSISEAIFIPEAGSGVALALAVGAVVLGSIPEGVLAGIRKWHGSIDEQFGNIDNIVNLVTEHQPQWMMPPDLLMQLTDNHNQLQTLINKCRTNAASTADRTLRNSLPPSTVSITKTLRHKCRKWNVSVRKSNVYIRN
jgi:hypothetical protein